MNGRRACWVLVVGLLWLGGCEEHAELARVPSEKEANRVLVVLEGRGIKTAAKVEKAEGREVVWSITVSPEELSSARSILVQNDLPRENPGGFATMIDKGGLIPTKQQERARMMYAMAGELEKTLGAIDRVAVARVHVVMPESDPFARGGSATTRPAAASAMVLIKYTPTDPAEGAAPAGKEHADAPVTAQQVQQMVARSVEGLTADEVYVTFTRAMVAEKPAATSATPSPAVSGRQKAMQMQLFAAAAAFGVLSIILVALLWREKRRSRLAGEGAAPA